jgi:hypothetical protein
MFSQNRDDLRNIYLDAWRKAKAGEPLQPLEQQIAATLRRHPEYQPLLDSGEDALDREWLPEQGESNPFLHLGLHLALLDQVTTDRPPGIRKLFDTLVRHCLGDTHEAEHLIMECLAEEIWKVQRYQREHDPKAYLKCVKRRAQRMRG